MAPNKKDPTAIFLAMIVFFQCTMDLHKFMYQLVYVTVTYKPLLIGSSLHCGSIMRAQAKGAFKNPAFGAFVLRKAFNALHL